jgi:hypothetical protein
MRSSSSLLPRLRGLAAAGVCAPLTLGLAACGSATANKQAATGATATTVAAAVSVANAAATASTPASCASAVAGTLGQVGERIYDVAATGGDVAEAVHRVQSSAALASAIDSGSAAGARAALRALLLGQIVRIEVLRGGRVLAAAGAGSALAPVRGSIPGTDASFVLSVQSDRGYVQVARQVTGAQVLLNPATGVPNGGALEYAGQSYQVVSLTGALYPSGALRIALLVPAREISCPASLAQARVETLGRVGERIYEEELHGASVVQTQRTLEASTAFQRAVAARDAIATHAAIDGFFAAHIHVVRVRVTVGSHLLVDVGGPYVLAPVHGTVRSDGRVVGHFTWAIQDDAGYLKLAHLFTGAEVLMRVGGQQVKGTLSPGPAAVPDRGEVSYGGRGYQAYSFTAEAFPSGPLRISLLIAS